MRNIGFIWFFMLISMTLMGQSWNQVRSNSIVNKGQRNINPDKFITAFVDDSEIKEILWSAPQELDFDPNKDVHTILKVMNSEGTIEDFSVVQYQMMEPGLAKRYDHIRTFHGLSTQDPTRRIRINYTVHGLRAVITDETGQTYIDHFQRKDKNHKIIYRRKDFSAHTDWECGVQGNSDGVDKHKKDSGSRSGDCLFRSYRFSITATGEYSNYHDAFDVADSSLVMSAIVTTVDRVNDVFEQDLTMRLILIDNVDDVFYYDPATDPFSGSSAGSMISQNQSNTDAVIGSSNYDLGHIVSTGGSGLASLGVVCANGLKARGVTGIAVPEGDPFDIDYVAHEIGHQLGANHTQNNSCNRNNSTAMEPGSASTIMGYAGICSPNVQNNSDAYFHAISVQEMNAELTSNSCHGVITLNNSAPIANSLTNKSIPHSTPFVLDVIATDNDEDVLTYNWEQMDNEVGPVMPPAGTNTQGPMFRSKFATTDSKRYFPNLGALTSNSTDLWEVLPTVNRNMDFRVTVRDNTFAPGCTDEQDITLDVEGNAGPFVVTSQNTATTWQETEDVTITWDVANTDVAPVSCQNVEILLSYDGGFTYPTTLVSSTPNTGSATVTVPVTTTTTGRIMVKCSDNVFFDINDSNITIEEGAPTFALNINPAFGDVCDNSSKTILVETESILGFTDPITLSVANLPPGASANIVTNPIIPGNNTQISINNLNDQSGNFSIDILGASGPIMKMKQYVLTVIDNDVFPLLSSPANGSTEEDFGPTLSWQSVTGATSYEYQVSLQPGGVNIINSGSTTNLSVVISPDLAIASTYYWRVRSNSICGASAWSEERTFVTKACFIKSSEDLPISITSVGTPTITSNLSIVDKGVVNDLNIVDLSGTHTYISDLNFTLIAPDGTNTAFWSDPCNNQNNFDINFDDEAASSNYPCPPTNGGTYIPDNPLTIYDTKQIQGDWVMSVFDDFDADGGQLNSWGIEICVDDYCDLTVDDEIFINNAGSLLYAINCATDGDTIFIESALAQEIIDAGSSTISIDHNIVIIADPTDNIKVVSDGNAPTFIINSGKTVSLIGFSIENGDSQSGVVENNGTLILQDMNIKSDQGEQSIINNPNANITIQGDCNVLSF